MKALLKLWLSLFFLFLLLKNISLQDLAHNIYSLSAKSILYSAFLFLASLSLSAYRWRLLVPTLNFKRLLCATFVGLYYSTVLPGQIAGEFVKAYRLGKGRSDAEKIAASVLVDKLVGLVALLVVASVGLMVSPTSIPLEVSVLIGLGTLFFCGGLFFLKFPFFYLLISSLFKKTADRWPRLDDHLPRLYRVLNAWENYLTEPLRLFYVFLLAILFQLLCVWIIIIFSHELKIDLPVADWCWIFGLVSIAVLLPISVGGIGVREGTFAGALSLQGIPIEKSMILSLAFFAIFLMGALIGGTLELFRSLSKLKVLGNK